MPDEQRVATAAKAVTDKIVNVGVTGAGPWKGSVQIAEEHLARHEDPEKAISRLIATHVRLTSTTGFLTGVGGLVTLPVTVPADLTALWLAQGRMAGGIAHIRGYDVTTEEVHSVVLLSLLGASGAEALAAAGVQIGTKSALSAVKKIPGRVLIEINKKVGFRLITKAGTKGVINLTKLVPLAGGVVGGGVNGVSTQAVGTWAKRNFAA
ncbi:EcsC family protein [Pseudokineococcus sp. 5B2Z-1]|uniref:EcsC family protein n=1 Tax=Pseudokineococcus sp. 5B2Z-1 TaxID=3132744 RepID=UPI003099B43D